MQPTRTAHAYETSPRAAPTSQPRPAAGIVFVPCGVCLAPVDLASVTGTGKPPRCDGHAATDPFSLS